VTKQDHTLPDEGRRRRRPWVVALPLAIFVLIALAWSGFWFYALSMTETALADWRAREATLGRNFYCGKQSIGGFPFRFELRCVDPSARFDYGARPTALAAKDFVTVAQIWQPTLLIGELVGPLTIGEADQPPAVSVSWSLAQASLRGLPIEPERAAVVIDELTVAGLDRGAQTMLANAGRVELHGRIASGSARDNPVLDLALDLSQASASRLGELAATPFDADIVAVLRGLKNLTPKSWPETLRALQAANGRLDITRARVIQGDVVATGSGSLGLTPRGALDGELQVTIANFEKLIPLLGIDRAVSQLVPQGTLERLAPGLDRLMPGLGGVLRGNASGPAAKAAIDALGKRTQLEGQSAVTLPLRFSDGAVLLGPFRLTEIPPLY
jgi:hypothetical protein